MSESEKVCGHCKHFHAQEKKLGEEQVGTCRAHPPMPVSFPVADKFGVKGIQTQGVWPPVKYSVSCGEWTPSLNSAVH